MLRAFPVVHCQETQRVIGIAQQVRANVSVGSPEQRHPGSRAVVMFQEFRDAMSLQQRYAASVTGARVNSEAVRDASAHQSKWRWTMDRYRIGWTLLPASHPLNQALALQSDWACVYRDDVAMIYVRLR